MNHFSSLLIEPWLFFQNYLNQLSFFFRQRIKIKIKSYFSSNNSSFSKVTCVFWLMSIIGIKLSIILLFINLLFIVLLLQQLLFLLLIKLLYQLLVLLLYRVELIPFFDRRWIKYLLSFFLTIFYILYCEKFSFVMSRFMANVNYFIYFKYLLISWSQLIFNNLNVKFN